MLKCFRGEQKIWQKIDSWRICVKGLQVFILLFFQLSCRFENLQTKKLGETT